MFIIINMVFFANVNLEAVASLCAVLISRASVFFFVFFFHIGSILGLKKNYLLYLNAIFLNNCTYLTFDLTMTLNQKITLGIHPYVVCNSPRNNSSLDAEH